MCKFSRIDCLDVGVHFEGGSLREPCKEMGQYYVKYNNHSEICQVQAKEFCYANKTFLQDALERGGGYESFRDVTSLTKMLAANLRTEIIEAKDDIWGAFASHKEKEDIASVSLMGSVLGNPNFIHRITTKVSSP